MFQLYGRLSICLLSHTYRSFNWTSYVFYTQSTFMWRSLTSNTSPTNDETNENNNGCNKLKLSKLFSIFFFQSLSFSLFHLSLAHSLSVYVVFKLSLPSNSELPSVILCYVNGNSSLHPFFLFGRFFTYNNTYTLGKSVPKSKLTLRIKIRLKWALDCQSYSCEGASWKLYFSILFGKHVNIFFSRENASTARDHFCLGSVIIEYAYKFSISKEKTLLTLQLCKFFSVWNYQVILWVDCMILVFVYKIYNTNAEIKITRWFSIINIIGYVFYIYHVLRYKFNTFNYC